MPNVLGLPVPLDRRYTEQGIEVTEHLDPRLKPLSARTKLLIASRFGGDVDLAVDHARVALHTQRCPEDWVRELCAPLPGWHDPLHITAGVRRF